MTAALRHELDGYCVELSENASIEIPGGGGAYFHAFQSASYVARVLDANRVIAVAALPVGAIWLGPIELRRAIRTAFPHLFKADPP